MVAICQLSISSTAIDVGVLEEVGPLEPFAGTWPRVELLELFPGLRVALWCSLRNYGTLCSTLQTIHTRLQCASNGARVIGAAEGLRFAILNSSVERDHGGNSPGNCNEERNTNENQAEHHANPPFQGSFRCRSRPAGLVNPHDRGYCSINDQQDQA
jgi:hypothetical protein